MSNAFGEVVVGYYMGHPMPLMCLCRHSLGWLCETCRDRALAEGGGHFASPEETAKMFPKKGKRKGGRC